MLKGEKQIHLPSNVEELNTTVNSRKLPFRIKIWHLLEYSKTHPADIPRIGIFWHDDCHFICNAKIVGNFLNLKDNSMNTNLRECGFNIDTAFQQNDLVAEFPNLPNLIRWKRRAHWQLAYTRQTTLEEVNYLTKPDLRGNDSSKDVSSPIFKAEVDLPEPMASFFKENPECLPDVIEIKRRIDAVDEEKDKYLSTAINNWNMMVKKGSLFVEDEDIANFAIAHSSRTIPPEYQDVVSVNIKDLLKDNIGFSQATNNVRFPDFFKLFLRFGSIENIATNVADVSYIPPKYVLNDMTDFDSDFPSLHSTPVSSQHSAVASFVSWLIRSDDRGAVNRYFQPQVMANPFAIKFSSSATRFTYVYRDTSNQLLFTHIAFDPLERDRPYTVGDDSSFRGSSLREVLSKHFGQAIYPFPADTSKEFRVAPASAPQ